MDGKSMSALIEAFDRYAAGRGNAEEYLRSRLDGFSKALATDRGLRQALPDNFPRLWSHISELWSAVQSGFEQTVSSDLILSLARFTRNLVAEVPKNQSAAFANEPNIRRLLYRLSSFSTLEDSTLFPLTRVLVQTLSNLVTLNNDLTVRLWTLYTALPEDQNILTRLLASPDARTVISVLVLIVNCMSSGDAFLRRLASPNGLRIVVLILDRTETWVDQDASENEGECFTLAYRIFETLLDRDLGATLYDSLSMEDEPVTPHQTTFLKILDSYLQHQSERTTSDDHQHSYLFLTTTFCELGLYSQRMIRHSLGLESAVQQENNTEEITSDDLKELDLRLPKVSAALILISQCLTTICLQDAKSCGASSSYKLVLKTTQAEGFIENLVETLRLVDRFLPRIVFGQAAGGLGQASPSMRNPMATDGFTYLKRDLVRLLGAICNERKEVQDRIRECGGIPVVMNLCVIDERNPYLQEHALFALRNILFRNPENQAVVDGMKLEQGKVSMPLP